MSTVHIRVTDTTKEAVKKIFEKLGLDMSTAIKLYFHQVILHKGLPSPLLTENGLTSGEESSILQAQLFSLECDTISMKQQNKKNQCTNPRNPSRKNPSPP